MEQEIKQLSFDPDNYLVDYFHEQSMRFLDVCGISETSLLSSQTSQ